MGVGGEGKRKWKRSSAEKMTVFSLFRSRFHRISFSSAPRVLHINLPTPRHIRLQWEGMGRRSWGQGFVVSFVRADISRYTGSVGTKDVCSMEDQGGWKGGVCLLLVSSYTDTCRMSPMDQETHLYLCLFRLPSNDFNVTG